MTTDSSMRPKRVSERLRRTAYHEAGHAVAGYLMRIRFTRVTIKDSRECLGSTQLVWSWGEWRPDMDDNFERVRDRMERFAVASLGGLTAELIITGCHDLDESEKDILDAAEVLEKVSGGDQLDAYIETMRRKTDSLLSVPKNRIAVVALAESLLQKQTLRERDARSIIRSAIGE